ncbi:MAG: NAD-dependent epimerase/dehydratase family protein [Halioglobus sp.]
MSQRLLITGAAGFTGRHLSLQAASRGVEAYELKSCLTDTAALAAELTGQIFDYVVHLAAISAVTHADEEELYRVNLFGTLNLMKALAESGHIPEKILVASSANIYGNSELSPVSETILPGPVNHYAMSKLSMEYMLRTVMDTFPIVIVRPFNYTGVWHDDRFVIPKIVAHFAAGENGIELGNTSVEREFNDVRTVVKVYFELLEKGIAGEVYNVCSGNPHSLDEVLEQLRELTGHDIAVTNNPAFMRANELQTLYGDPSKLEACIGEVSHPSLKETLSWMLAAHV